MTGNVRRAGAFALVGALSLVVPATAGRPATVRVVVGTLPFLAVAALALYGVDDGPVFELLARPGDYEDGRLYGLAGFSLAAAGLAILATRFGLPPSTFVASVFVLGVGNLAQELARTRLGEFPAAAAFAVGGMAGGTGSALLGSSLVGSAMPVALAAFLAASGALLAGMLRAVLFERDDPLVMVTVAFLLWLFADLGITADPTRVVVGIAVTVALGYVAYALGTASIAGMLTGDLLALLAVVVGGYGWFALLITFFGLGGVAAKFRYEEKRKRGIAEANQGARGSGNVLANSAVALVAVLAFAASEHAPVPPEVFLFAFAGSVATAMSDTLSSEIGGLYDAPRLVTTFERVEPGTDGAVTWQGELAGIVGAALIAGIGALFFDFGVVAVGVVVAAGVLGMSVDSLLGATIEGDLVGNQGVNLLATAAGALVGAALALATVVA